MKFYVLEPAEDLDEAHCSLADYADDWEDAHPWAKWTAESLREIRCPVDAAHNRRAVREDTDLEVCLSVPEGWERGMDFVWTDRGECLVGERALKLLRRAALQGFSVLPVRARQGEGIAARLWWLTAVREVAAQPESGIRLLDRCPACGWERYSEAEKGIFIDEACAPGADFLRLAGYASLMLVSQRVRSLIVVESLDNCALTPAGVWMP